ncbi:DUF4422 domain-containing protein [Dialister succinatiphilus]|uniref:DUF4422 domain-containing protein n=1 Tax=Dialister succinatiphilus YIT 11850 TaxID=742743 RepID=H1D0G0_9FIRM|nr:DUF4422 domain-containing protein [Dialister succinatiphilus]EHO62984.1 hypothetical protein HMPREF9453_01098 [Dialister succinatiphilus YIT 11850]
MDIKILIAAHKKYWLPDDPVYFPLQVGAEGKNGLGITKDDSGDNISNKNPYFCELTGLYWAWKNLSCDYIGLCHYRRYFAHNGIYTSPEKMKRLILKQEDYVDIFKNYDIILPPKHRIRDKTVKEQYAKSHNVRDLDEAIKIIIEKYPDYEDTVNSFFHQSEIYYYNMFAMKKCYFDNYCSWIFDILFTLEQTIDISSYDAHQSRVYGFLAERLFNVWINQQDLKIKNVPVVFLEEKKRSLWVNTKRYFSQMCL